MRKVLVAVDGSEAAGRAVDHVAALAAAGARFAVHLLYVMDDISYDRSHAFHSTQELERPGRDRGEAVLNAAARRLAASATQMQVTTELLFGDAAEVIVAQAEQQGCDSIILGMKNQGLLAELVLGSTTQSVLHATSLPVTLVK